MQEEGLYDAELIFHGDNEFSLICYYDNNYYSWPVNDKLVQPTGQGIRTC